MSCKAIRYKLSAYLDGELAGFDMLDIRSHLHRCRACELEYDELRRLKRLMANFPDTDPGVDFARELKNKVFQPSGRRSPGRVPVAMISGLAFAAALLVSLAAMHNHHGQIGAASVSSEPSTSPSFDLGRDQAYQNGGDFFNDSTMVIPAASSYHGSQ